MKKINRYIILAAATVFLFSCKKESDSNKPVLKLSPEFVNQKAGTSATATLSGTVPNGVKKFSIIKTVNLVPDNSYAPNGELEITDVAAGSTSFNYTLDFVLKGDEVDKLTGYTFHVEDVNGNVSEKDLTVNTLTSGALTIASHPWKLISKFWQTYDPPNEAIQDCEKDNTWSYNSDSTIILDYGASGCLFDGFNIFDKWWLSDDEKKFYQVYHSIFDPTKITTEEYDVKTLTKDKLVMDIALDLSAFGLSDHEIFTLTFVPF
ncbi:MAG TPA: hypothetical protein PL045_10855 [Chitinophagaceae bacterium]|nr:hypothetical protein [Chitinophagaceae bacterium]